MRYDWYEISHDARDLIEQTALNVFEDYADSTPIEERVGDACANATMFEDDKLTLIAYYDFDDLFYGSECGCFEDSPAGQFERDVWMRVYQIMEGKE